MPTESNIAVADDPAATKFLRTLQQSIGGLPRELEVTVQGDPNDPTAFPLGSLTDAESVNSVIGLLKRLVSRLVGNIPAAATLQALPTSTTALIGSTCNVLAMFFANPTGSAINVTVTDGQGSPVAGLSNFTLLAGALVRQEWNGVSFTGGVKWSASAPGVNGAVVAYQ